MVRLFSGFYIILCLHLLQSFLADTSTIYSYVFCQWHPGIFADKKNTSSDSSKPPFQFGGNNVIFGDKKDTAVDSSKPFQFGANNGFPTSNAPSIFSSVPQSFSPQSPPLFSMNQQSVLSGIFSDLFLVLFTSHLCGLRYWCLYRYIVRLVCSEYLKNDLRRTCLLPI